MADRRKFHPAENRAYRELYVASRQLINRWGRLASALDGTRFARAIERASSTVEELVSELGPRTAEYGVHGGPAAQGVGARIADVRSAVADRSVDTGMVMRLAVLDIEHIATLLRHLAELARARGDARLAKFCEDWATRIRTEVRAVRKAAVEVGADPDRAAAPLDTSLIGRAVHGAGWVVGSVGETVDRVTAPRRRGKSKT
jgi:hypothetical protein